MSKNLHKLRQLRDTVEILLLHKLKSILYIHKKSAFCRFWFRICVCCVSRLLKKIVKKSAKHWMIMKVSINWNISFKHAKVQLFLFSGDRAIIYFRIGVWVSGFQDDILKDAQNQPIIHWIKIPLLYKLAPLL